MGKYGSIMTEIGLADTFAAVYVMSKLIVNPNLNNCARLDQLVSQIEGGVEWCARQVKDPDEDLLHEDYRCALSLFGRVVSALLEDTPHLRRVINKDIMDKCYES